MGKLEFDFILLNYCISLLFRTDMDKLSDDFRLVEELMSMAAPPDESGLAIMYEFLRLMIETKSVSVIFDINTLYIHLRGDETLMTMFDDYEKGMDAVTNDQRNSVRLYLQRKIQYHAVSQSLEELATYKDILNMDEEVYNTPDFLALITKIQATSIKIDKVIRRNTDKSKFESDDFMIGGNAESGIETLIKVREENTNPSARLKTSVQLKNKMFNGGFKGGKVYMFIAPPGVGKSTELLLDSLDIAECNKEIILKNGNLKPCVLYVTHENSQAETMERIFDAHNEKRIEDHTVEELKEAYAKLPINQPNTKVSFISMYRPNFSITCNDIRDYIDQLASNGYEVIALAHDYIKRIRSIESGISRENTYLELGNIVNEFKDLAEYYRIPVLLASQVNRDAFSKIEQANSSKRKDIGKLLGMSQIGESVRISENVDYLVSLYKEMDENEIEYMTYKLLKKREKQTSDDITYFAHPFSKKYFRYESDIYLEHPISKLSLIENTGNPDSYSADRIEQRNNGLIKRRVVIPEEQKATEV